MKKLQLVISDIFDWILFATVVGGMLVILNAATFQLLS